MPRKNMSRYLVTIPPKAGWKVSKLKETQKAVKCACLTEILTDVSPEQKRMD